MEIKMAIRSLELRAQSQAPAAPVSGSRKLFLNADGQLCYVKPDGTVEPIGGGSNGVSSWNDLTDKPSTFPPSAHNHYYSEIIGTPPQSLFDWYADGAITPCTEPVNPARLVANSAFVINSDGSLSPNQTVTISDASFSTDNNNLVPVAL